MKLRFSIVCVLSFVLQCRSYRSNYQIKIPLELTPALPSASLETFPYHAMVIGSKKCNGILISKDYVITPAVCVYGSRRFMVYIGYKKHPLYVTTPNNDPNMKIYISHEVKIHQDFIKVDEYRYLNNIALVKLPEPAHVEPAKLASKQTIEKFLEENDNANITGWMLSSNTDLMVAEVNLRNQDTCKVLFGQNQLFDNQEICVKWPTLTHLNLLGNPLSFKGKVIGLQTLTPNCAVAVSSCSRNDLILNFLPFLSWISRHANVAIENYANHEETFRKTVEALKASQENDRTNFNKRIDDLAARIANNQFGLSLDEQIKDMRSEIRNNESKLNGTILKLQEEFAGARTEITNGLTAVRAGNENIAKRVNETIKSKQDERILKIENFISDLKNQELKKVNDALGNFDVKLQKLQLDDISTLSSLRNLSIDISAISKRIYQESAESQSKTKHLEEALKEHHEKLLLGFDKNKDEIEEACRRLTLLETIVNRSKAHFEGQLLKEIDKILLFNRSVSELGDKVKQCCAFADYEIPAN